MTDKDLEGGVNTVEHGNHDYKIGVVDVLGSLSDICTDRRSFDQWISPEKPPGKNVPWLCTKLRLLENDKTRRVNCSLILCYLPVNLSA